MAVKKTYRTKLAPDGFFIPVPFDPKETFGKVRAPVKVTVNGYTFRSTIFSMNGTIGIPFRTSNRDAAGVEGHETLDVTLELDTEVRDVDPPDDLVAALQAAPPAWDRWQELSFTHKREWVEAVDGAKKPETRARRIADAVAKVSARPAKKR